MTISVDIELENGIAIVTCHGVVRLTDAQKGAAELWKTPGWLGRSAVWDFREARFDLSSSDLQEIADFIHRHQPAVPPSRVAFVTGRDVDFGLARVFEVFRQDPRTEFRVFRDYDEAINWVRELAHQVPADPFYPEAMERAPMSGKLFSRACKGKTSTRRIQPGENRASGLPELVRAAENGNLEGVINLVQGGADINQRDDRGSTALHHAACGKYQIAEFLLSSGADTEAADSDGLTPLHVAFLRHDRTMFEVLVNHGADVNRPLPDGRTPATMVRDQKYWQL